MTDYSAYIDSFRGIAYVVSLRKNGESISDRVTITAANKKYLASVNKLDEEFVPNRPYTYYIVHDTNLHTADQNMYKNKAEYYSNTPGADRRRR
jgi:hypothetical protein